MSTDFRRWEGYDAEGESAKLDAAAALEEAAELKQAVAGVRGAFEAAGIAAAEDLAETAAARARVAALGSSRGRGRRGRRTRTDGSGSGGGGDPSVIAAAAPSPPGPGATAQAPTPPQQLPPPQQPPPQATGAAAAAIAAPTPPVVAPVVGGSEAVIADAAAAAAAAAEHLAALTRKLRGLTEGREAAVRLSRRTDDSQGGRGGGGENGKLVEEALEAFEKLLADVADTECMLPLDNFSEDGGNDDDGEGGGGGGGGGGSGDNSEGSASSSSSSSSAPLLAAGGLGGSSAVWGAMRTTVRSVRLDVLRGLGTCQLRLGRRAEASETLKALLLLDPEDGEAWRSRGDAFRAMGVRSLAELHYDQSPHPDDDGDDVDDVDDTDDIGDSGDANGDQSPPQPPSGPKVSSSSSEGGAAEGDSLDLSSSEQARSLALEGLVLFREQFFRSALGKFEEAVAIAALCLRRTNHHHNNNNDGLLTKPPPAPAPATPAAAATAAGRLLELEASCRLNAAACCLLRQQDYDVAEAHCSGALHVANRAMEMRLTTTTMAAADKANGTHDGVLGSNQGGGGSNGNGAAWADSVVTKALLRRAEARRRMGLFRSGTSDLERVQRMCESSSSSSSAPSSSPSLTAGGAAQDSEQQALRKEVARLLSQMRFTASQIDASVTAEGEDDSGEQMTTTTTTTTTTAGALSAAAAAEGTSDEARQALECDAMGAWEAGQRSRAARDLREEEG